MATAAAFFAATLYVSIRYLAKPHGFMDWTVQLTGATIAAVIGFFLMWGHWQSPVDDNNSASSGAGNTVGKTKPNTSPSN
ncbi:MAG: hypothetical protein ACP5O1_05090 [Phycisphaerae bacterium]